MAIKKELSKQTEITWVATREQRNNAKKQHPGNWAGLNQSEVAIDILAKYSYTLCTDQIVILELEPVCCKKQQKKFLTDCWFAE